MSPCAEPRRLACAPHTVDSGAASRRWPGRCWWRSWRCWPSRTVDTVLVARYAAPTWRRWRWAWRPTSPCSSASWASVLAIGPIVGQLFGARQPARGRAAAAPGGVGGARAVGAGQRAAGLPVPVPGAVAGQARGRRQGARLPDRAGLLAAGGAAVHRLPRLQHRGVAAEGGDGDPGRRAGAEGAAVDRAGLRRAGARRCRAGRAPAAASPPRSRCGRRCWSGCWCCGATPSTRRFDLLGHGLRRPDRKAIAAQLRLGMPMGASILIEVTGFAFMALFIARLGTTPVAGHQIAVNLVSMMFMMPLALANATSTLVAQSVGAGDAADARRLGWHGLLIGVALAALLGAAVYFAARTGAAAVHRRRGDHRRGAAAAGLGGGVPRRRRGAERSRRSSLRAYKIATVPMVIYAVCAVGRRPGRRLRAGLRRHRVDAARAAGRARLLGGRDGRAGAGRAERPQRGAGRWVLRRRR